MTAAAGQVPTPQRHTSTAPRGGRNGGRVEEGIRVARTTLTELGVSVNPGRVSKWVRKFYAIEPYGDLRAEVRRRALGGYLDVTGETATRNVDRERGGRP